MTCGGGEGGGEESRRRLGVSAAEMESPCGEAEGR